MTTTRELSDIYRQLFPLIIMSQTRREMIERFEQSDASSEAFTGGVNAIGHVRVLCGPNTRERVCQDFCGLVVI